MANHPNRGWRSRWSIDLETATATHRDGWVFKFSPAADQAGAFDGKCIAQPSPLTAEQLAKTHRIAREAGTLYNLVKFGKDDQAYRDVPIHDKRSTIWVVRRRYKCNSCNSTFRPDLKDMDDRRMMTKRLVRHIEKAALLDIPNKPK